MKIVFPKPGYTLTCEVCGAKLGGEDGGTSEDGDVEDYWCSVCIDFRGGILKVTKGQAISRGRSKTRYPKKRKDMF